MGHDLLFMIDRTFCSCHELHGCRVKGRQIRVKLSRTTLSMMDLSDVDGNKIDIGDLVIEKESFCWRLYRHVGDFLSKKVTNLLNLSPKLSPKSVTNIDKDTLMF